MGMTALDTERDKERTRVADLIRVATQGDVNTQLKQQEIQQRANELKSMDDFRKGSLGLRGKEVDVSERIVGLREELSKSTALGTKARAVADEQLAKRYSVETKKTQQTLDIIDRYLEGGGTAAEDDMAKKALGLPIEGPTEKRQMDKDLVKAESQILDLDSADAIPYMRFFNEGTKGNYGYFWDTKRWNEVIKVDLGKLGGMEKAKKDALSLGISITDYLEQIYNHPNYKGK